MTPEQDAQARQLPALVVGLRLLHGWDLRCACCGTRLPPDSDTLVPTETPVCFECGVSKFGEGVGVHGDLLNSLVKMAFAQLGPEPMRAQLRAESIAHMHAYVADAAKKERG